MTDESSGGNRVDRALFIATVHGKAYAQAIRSQRVSDGVAVGESESFSHTLILLSRICARKQVEFH